MTDGPWRLSWGRIVFGAVLIIVGIGWLLESAGILDFPLRSLAPLALIVVGVGLVFGSRHGSYPGLIILGVALTVVLAADSVAERRDTRLELGAGVGDRIQRPTTAAELRPYRIDAGRLTIDLTHLRLEPRTYSVEARVGAGQIHVIVPRGVPFRVDARSSVGNAEILGEERSSGVGVDQRFSAPGFAEARPRFDLTLRAGVGSIRVTQGPRRAPVELRERDGVRMRRGSATSRVEPGTKGDRWIVVN